MARVTREGLLVFHGLGGSATSLMGWRFADVGSPAEALTAALVHIAARHGVQLAPVECETLPTPDQERATLDALAAMRWGPG